MCLINTFYLVTLDLETKLGFLTEDAAVEWFWDRPPQGFISGNW